jgi:hypothetical protein
VRKHEAAAKPIGSIPDDLTAITTAAITMIKAGILHEMERP